MGLDPENRRKCKHGIRVKKRRRKKRELPEKRNGEIKLAAPKAPFRNEKRS